MIFLCLFRRIGALFAAFLVSLSAYAAGSAVVAECGWNQVPAILQRIRPPVFPDRDFDIVKYDADTTGKRDSRPAILAAMEACIKAGGGRVVLPAGDYLCNGPIHLKSGVNLHLAEGCTLRFGTNPDDYLVGDPAKGGCVPVTWEGTRCYNYSPFIYAYDQSGIAISGKGTVDGQAGKGWTAWRGKQTPAQKKLRGMGCDGVPVEQRVFGKGCFLRPSLVEFQECSGVVLDGITVKSSPFWTLHPVRCTNVTVRNVTVNGLDWNDDGCDPESCTDVLIEGCAFTTRDDNIAIKAGRDRDGWAESGGRLCENIVIRNCRFLIGSPGGVSIGSEMSGSVRNVFVESCTMGKAQSPLYIKSNPDRGGEVENVWARDITVEECQALIRCEMNYKNIAKGPKPPAFRDLHVERVTCKKAECVIDCRGLPGQPIRGVWIKDVTVEKAKVPMTVAQVEKLHLDNVRVNGMLLAPPPE